MQSKGGMSMKRRSALGFVSAVMLTQCTPGSSAPGDGTSSDATDVATEMVAPDVSMMSDANHEQDVVSMTDVTTLDAMDSATDASDSAVNDVAQETMTPSDAMMTAPVQRKRLAVLTHPLTRPAANLRAA
jgi:hypothetical protein